MSGRDLVSFTVSVVLRAMIPEAVFALPSMTACPPTMSGPMSPFPTAGACMTGLSTRLIAAAKFAAVSGLPSEKRRPLRM